MYLWAVIVTVTAVAEFGGGFMAALFGIESTPVVGLVTAVGLLLLALAFNFSGTHMLARIAKIGLGAELVGVIALGLYSPDLPSGRTPSRCSSTPWARGGDAAYIVTFFGAALSGLFLFYGFEACGNVAEEVDDPTRRIPRAMMLTILIGGVSGLLSYIGYVLAAPTFRRSSTARSPIRSRRSWRTRWARWGPRSSSLSRSPRSSRACCPCRQPAADSSTRRPATGCCR